MSESDPTNKYDLKESFYAWDLRAAMEKNGLTLEQAAEKFREEVRSKPEDPDLPDRKVHLEAIESAVEEIKRNDAKLKE